MSELIERRDQDAVLLLVQTIHDNVKALDDKVTDHIGKEPTELAAAIAELILKAFPDGDLEGHRKAHQAQIKQMEDRAAFWQRMRFELVKWGLIGFLGWLIVDVGRSLANALIVR